MTELSERLRALASKAGFDDQGGISRLHRLLVDSHGCNVRLQSVSYWLRGDRRPEPRHLRALLDALDARGDERTEIARMVMPEGLDALLSSNRDPATGAA